MPKTNSTESAKRNVSAATMIAAAITLIYCILSAAPVQAQQPPFDKEKLVQAQKQNASALMQYTWKSRTELKLKGESKSIKLDQVRYDLNGQIQKTPIEGAPPQEQEEQQASGRRGSRIKEKIIEHKKDEFEDLMQALGQLVISYGHIPPDKLQSFVQNAVFTQGKDALQGTVMIQGQNVLQPGDTLTIWIDPTTCMMRHIEINTLLDKKPVAVVVEYKSLEAGPAYQSRATVTYPDKELVLMVDNYDYVRVAS